MASIRRTLSPYHDQDRSYTHHHNNNNGVGANLKLLSNEKSSSSSSTLRGKLRSCFSKLSQHRFYYFSRKGQPWWKRSLYTFFFFFLLGFLYGMAPFAATHHRLALHREFTATVPPPPSPPLPPVSFKDVDRNARYGVEPDQVLIDSVISLGSVSSSNMTDRFDLVPRKQLIVVTPTYNRAFQAYYLNRLAHTLRLVPPPLLWIVVEMNSASVETSEILKNTGVMYRHLVCTKNFTNVKDRGVHQRNTALVHIEHHKLDGILYFADDDNIYSLNLFHSLRQISRFGTWPVAMLAQSKNKAILEGPVCNGSVVNGWHTNEKSKRLRRFHVDMSGFAFNSTILWDPRRWRRPTISPIRQLDTVKEGFQETTFIEQLVEDESQMEGITSGCSHVLNWHLHLGTRDIAYPRGWLIHKNLDVVLPV